MTTEAILREATIDDIETLVAHHVAMFREIMLIANKDIADESYRRMAVSHTRKLNEQMPVRLCIAWILVNPFAGSLPLASAALTIQNAVPTPYDDECKVGLLHSVYTEKEWRKKGYAELLVKKVLDHAKGIGLNRVDLAASEAGRHLYDKIGFVDVQSMMRIYLRENG